MNARSSVVIFLRQALCRAASRGVCRPLVALAVGLWWLPVATLGASEPLLVFAAASLKESLDEQLERFSRSTGVAVRASYAGSHTLAQQIDRGAPASVFISADERWMSFLLDRRRVVAETQRRWLGNELVLIAPSAQPGGGVALNREARTAIQAALSNSRFAIADPVLVPAGRYAQAALTRLGLWDVVAPRIATTDSVRGALAFVARGEAALGAVYRTDALAEPRVRVVASFPPESHPAITYPAAIVAAHDRPAARQLLEYLASEAARPVWTRYGFLLSTP